jgi:hypothetical protein
MRDVYILYCMLQGGLWGWLTHHMIASYNVWSGEEGRYNRKRSTQPQLRLASASLCCTDRVRCGRVPSRRTPLDSLIASGILEVYTRA